MLLYFVRCAEMFITSIVCSIPGFLALFGVVARGSDTYTKMQLVFFCIYVLGIYISQRKVYMYDKRRMYYLTISLVGLLPYTLLSIICCLIAPVRYYSLVFLPDLFFGLLGAPKTVSVLLANLGIYIIVLTYPYLRHLLRGR